VTLDGLFPDEDYRFQLRFERSEPAKFFGPTPAHEKLVAERCHWIETDPNRYAALLCEGEPLLVETLGLASAWGTLSQSYPDSGPQTPWTNCLNLGLQWEPDYLLLKLDGVQFPRLVGGSVCFPSSWSLAEKIGKPLQMIHDVVPGLNSTIGPQISAFLARLRPGIAWMRQNWGLSRSAELNQHPARQLRKLDCAVGLDEVWLRIEHQALVALPGSKGILFGIRIATHPLQQLREQATVAKGLSRALRTMPTAMAAYKGLAECRARLLQLLQ
jgi:hypothetical protein